MRNEAGRLLVTPSPCLSCHKVAEAEDGGTIEVWGDGTAIEVWGKRLNVKYVPGPVGVHARNFSKARIHSLGWRAKVSLKEGIVRTYVFSVPSERLAEPTGHSRWRQRSGWQIEQ